MNPVQYILVERDNGMSPGKLAAQVAHAAVEGVRVSAKEPWGNPWDSSIVNRWYLGGHYAKIVLQCDDLEIAERYIRERGIKVQPVIDEGRTEFGGVLTFTALGSEIVDKDNPHVRETFSVFRLYNPVPGKDTRPKVGRVVQTWRKFNAAISRGRGRSGRQW